MGTNLLKTHWKEAKSQLKQQWNKLSDNDLKVIDGDIDKLLTTLEKHYSYTKAQAIAEVKQFNDKYKKNGVSTSIHDSNKSHDSDPSDMERANGQSSSTQKNVVRDVFRETKEVAEHLKKDAQEYRKTVVDFIEKKPYQSLAIAALGGLVLGFIFKKK